MIYLHNTKSQKENHWFTEFGTTSRFKVRSYYLNHTPVHHQKPHVPLCYINKHKVLRAFGPCPYNNDDMPLYYQINQLTADNIHVEWFLFFNHTFHVNRTHNLTKDSIFDVKCPYFAPETSQHYWAKHIFYFFSTNEWKSTHLKTHIFPNSKYLQLRASDLFDRNCKLHSNN